MLSQQDYISLADQYMDMVYRVALNSLRHPADAEDVTQNVMLRLLRAAPEFESGDHAKHWLIRVTINESKRLLTAPWRTRTLPLDQADHLPSRDSQEGELLNAVLELPVKYRLPLYLYYYEGYSVAEVGQLLGRPVSTVQTQLARGRDKLKDTLTGEGG